MRKLGLLAGTLMALLSCADSSALTLEKIKFGDFSNWVTREITESKVIGGKTKTVYAIGPTQMIKGNETTSSLPNFLPAFTMVLTKFLP